MKKIQIFITLLLSSGVIFAQSFSVHFDATSANGNPMDELVIEGVITNTTETEKVLFITRENQNLPDGWSSSLCFRSCFAPWVSTISDTIPGSGTLNFSIHFNTLAEPGSADAILSVALANDAEKEEFNLYASTNPTNLDDKRVVTNTFKLHGNYPNPFNGETIIQFETNVATSDARIIVFDITGKEVFSDRFHVTSGIQNYHLNFGYSKERELSSGIYFYQITFTGIEHLKQSLFGKFNLIK